jgi:hypothetical protein
MKNKEPLKVGDRVAVYTRDGRFPGTITTLYPEGSYRDTFFVELDDERGETHFHKKQCRRLVKKPKREFWLDFAVEHATKEGALNAARYNGSQKILRVRVTEEIEIK